LLGDHNGIKSRAFANEVKRGGLKKVKSLAIETDRASSLFAVDNFPSLTKFAMFSRAIGDDHIRKAALKSYALVPTYIRASSSLHEYNTDMELENSQEGFWTYKCSARGLQNSGDRDCAYSGS